MLTLAAMSMMTGEKKDAKKDWIAQAVGTVGPWGQVISPESSADEEVG